MLLKCPICGKKYAYDSKICPDCEEFSRYSGLMVENDTSTEKWNCAYFLQTNSIVFRNPLLSTPLKLQRIDEKEKICWNYGVLSAFNTKGYSHEVLNADKKQEFLKQESNYIEIRKENPFLIYE
ncbi:MAG: hypothetical protein ACTSUX_04625 [Promethearchaeota archaeon]